MNERIFRLRFRCDNCSLIHQATGTLDQVTPVIRRLAEEGVTLFELQDDVTLRMRELDQSSEFAVFEFKDFNGRGIA